MYSIYLNSRIELLVLIVRVLNFKAVAGLASMLNIIFNMEVAKIKASFLFLWASDICLNNGSSNSNFNKSFDSSLGFSGCNFCLEFW